MVLSWMQKKTLAPEIIERNPFVVEQPVNEDIPVEDLIRHRLKYINKNK